LEKQQEKRIKNKEKCTDSIIFYGLWQSPREVEENMLTLNSDAQKREGLQAQLKFRKSVLLQKHPDKSVYSFSYKTESGAYKKHPVTILKENLLKLITKAYEGPSKEVHQPDIPLLVGKRVRHTFHDESYTGRVISVVPGYPDYYNIVYDVEREEKRTGSVGVVYTYRLLDDYRAGDLTLLV